MSKMKYWKRIIVLLLVITLVCQYGSMLHVSAKAETVSPQTTSTEISEENESESSTEEQTSEVSESSTEDVSDEATEETTQEVKETTTEDTTVVSETTTQEESQEETTKGKLKLKKNNVTVADGRIDMADYITECTITSKGTDTNISSVQGLEKNAKITVSIKYNPTDVKFENSSDVIYYQLPDGIYINSDLTGPVKTNVEIDGVPTNLTAGNYTISTTGMITINFSDAYINGDLGVVTNGMLTNGTIQFDAQLNGSVWGNGGDQNLVIGNIKIPLHFKHYDDKAEVEITKSAVGNEVKKDGNDYYVEYKITAKASADNTMTATNVTVKDVFSEGAEYFDWSRINVVSPSGTKLTKAKTNSSISGDNDTLVWTVGDLAPSESQTLDFKIYLKKYSEDSQLSHTMTNKAHGYVNGEPSGVSPQVSVSQKVKFTISKTSGGYISNVSTAYDSSISEPGYTSYEKYTITVTADEDNAWTVPNVSVIEYPDKSMQDTECFKFDESRVTIDGVSATKATGEEISSGQFKVGSLKDLISTQDSNVNQDYQIMRVNVGSMSSGTSKSVNLVCKIADTFFTGDSPNVQKNTNGEYTIYCDDIKNLAFLYVNDIVSTDYVTTATGKFYAESNSETYSKTWITKDGYATGKNKAHFTVQANLQDSLSPKFENQTLTLTDTLDSYWQYDGQITMQLFEYSSLYNQYISVNSNTLNEICQKCNTDDNPTTTVKNGKLTFTPQATDSWTWVAPEGYGKYTYIIDYDVKLKNEDAIGTLSFVNTAGIGVGMNGHQYSFIAKHTTFFTGYRNVAIKKEFVSLDESDEKNPIASWKTSVIRDVQNGSYYLDWCDNRPISSYGKWTISPEQIAAIEIYSDGGSKKLVAGEDFKAESYTGDNMQVGFKITFLKDIEASESSPIIIAYQCKLSAESLQYGETQTYENNASIKIDTESRYEDKTSATCQYFKEKKIVKTLDKYDADKGEITWKIRINSKGNMEGSATVEDDLTDEGLEFVGEYTKEKLTWDKGTNAGNVKIDSVVQEGQKITIQISDLQKDYSAQSWVDIKLTTKIVSQEFLLGNGDKVVIKNKASLNYKGGTQSSEAQCDASNKSLEKEGIYDKDPDSPNYGNIKYVVYVNPHGFDMLENSDTIRLEDTMGSNMLLKSETLTVQEVKTRDSKNPDNDVMTGNPIDVTGSLTVENNVFTFDVPDDKYLKITYYAYVTGQNPSSVAVTNTIRYKGVDYSPSIGGTQTVEIVSHSATIDTYNFFSVYKIDGTTMNTPLPNAQYELYQVNEDGSLDESSKVAVVSNTSGYAIFKLETAKRDASGNPEKDKNGKIVRTGVYAFKEVAAPEGYYIDAENKALTYIAFKQSDANIITDTAISKKILIVKNNTVMERYNYKGEITIDKSFVGGEIADGNYYFGLFDSNNKLVQTTSLTVKNGSFTYPTVFKNVDFGTYTVREVADEKGTALPTLSGDDAGATLINSTKYIISGEGEVTVSEDSPKQTIEITNTYKPLEVTLDAIKAYNSSVMKEFKFMLLNQNGNTVEIVENDNNGKIEFSPLTFTSKDVGKTYTYTVKEAVPTTVNEKNPTKAGITYDFTTHTVQVQINQSKTTGLNATVSVDGKEIPKSNGVYAITGTDATFTNTYNVTGTVTIKGTKKLVKEDGTELAMNANDYEFVIASKDGTPLANGTNDANGKFEIKLSSFTATDIGKTYKYVVREKNTGKALITYDTTEYELSVTVKDNKDGTLGFDVLVDGNKYDKDKIVFTNAYDSFRGSVVLTKTDATDTSKKLEGAEFTLKKSDGTVVASKVTDENGEIRVGNLTAGKYYFEETKAPASYTYDSNKNKYEFTIAKGSSNTVEVNVSVTNTKKTGTLKLQKTNANGKALSGVKFNLYKVGDSTPYDTYTSDANGIVTAEDLPWGDYYFKECETVAGYVLDELATKTVTIDAAYVDGEVTTLTMTNTKVQFAKVDSTDTTKSVSGATLEITTPDGTIMRWNSGESISSQLKPGLYTIKEVTTPTGYLAIPEGTSFTLNTDGSITTTSTYIATRTEEDKSVTILIKDKPTTPVSVVLKATKTVKDAVESENAAAKSFTFDLYEEGNKTPIDTQTVEVIGSNVESILFDKITYNDATEKTYTIKEKIPSGDDKLAGITYDNIEYKIKVTVTKDEQKLDVKVEQVGDTPTIIEKKDGVYELPKQTIDGTELASFVNVYSTSTTLTLEGTKTVSGITGGTPSAGTYQFILTDPDGNETTAKNDADGKFTFDTITYTDKDIKKTQPLTYTIKEDTTYNKQADVTYDLSVYTVQVTLSDDGNGNLTATKKILLGTEEKNAITFTNTFKGSVTLTKTNGKSGDARLTLQGAKFKLYKKDGTLVGEERTTNSDGQIIVNDLAEGEYYFVETEAPTGYVLDSTQHAFTIDQDGKADLAKANVSLEVSNTEKTGSIKLTKTGANSAKLAGAVFKLQRKVNNEFVDYTVANQVVTGTTDANGEITFTKLPWGRYQLVEIQAPTGYILDATPTNAVEITASNVDTTQTVSKTNTQNKVVIKKVDADDTTKNLSGAKLNLYKKAEGENSTNTFIESWTSSETNTSWTLEGKLEGGKTYIIEEETAPTGYLATSNIEFTMNTDGTVDNTSAEVKKEDGTQVIYVKDSTTQPVSVTIKGTKLLENGDDNHQKTFTFGLFKEGETKATYTTTAEVGSRTVEFTFPALSYSDAANEEYEIREIAPEGVTASSPTKDGTTYDLSTTYSVHIVVTKDQTKGLTLKINDTAQTLDKNSAVTYELPKGNKAASFVNTYSAKKTLTISGKKTLNGAALKNEAYSFTIASYTATDNTASTSTTIATVKNDASGNFTFTLPEFTQSDRNQTFTYQVKEVNTGVKGVTYDTTTHTVAVTVNDNGLGELSFTVVYDGGSNNGIEFVNEFNGEAELTKTDATTGKVLSGAVFKLCKKDGTVVKEKLTTGSDGKISVSSLAEGEYYFEETAAPTGYKLNTAKHAFTISQDGTTASNNVKVSLTATNKEKTGSITLLKTDEGGNPLQGAKFNLYKDNEVQKDSNKAKVYTTDNNGKIELTGLAWGTYYFVETEAPEGYSLDATPTASVTIDATHVDAVQTVTKVNQMLKSLTLIKNVEGEFANPTKKFTFTITLKKIDGTTTTPLTGKYTVTSSVVSGTSTTAPSISELNFTNGVAEVKLSHGQSITIEGLPYNYTIDSIVEEKVDGYTTTIIAPSDATIDNSNRKVELKDSSKIAKATTIVYTNEFASPSPTGIDMDTMLYAMIFGMGIIIGALFLARRRKRR